MAIKIENYREQSVGAWPSDGRCILAQFDERSVVVYKAYRPSIGHFAVEHQYFGGDFGLVAPSEWGIHAADAVTFV